MANEYVVAGQGVEVLTSGGDPQLAVPAQTLEVLCRAIHPPPLDPTYKRRRAFPTIQSCIDPNE